MNKLSIISIAALLGAVAGYSVVKDTSAIDAAESILGLLVADAVADSHTEKPAAIFQRMRASSVYVNPPELARFGYSNAVVVNNWTGFKKLPPVFSEGRDGGMQKQTHSALKRLQQMLKKNAIPNRHIIGLDVYFEGSKFDDVMAISEILEGFFASRTSYKTNPETLVDMPVRNIFGVKSLREQYGRDAADSGLVLVPTILDPETTTSERLSDLKASPARKDGHATFLIGGLMSQDLGFSVATEDQPKAALSNLDIVLRDIGATRKDIEKLKVSYVATSGLTVESIRPQIAEFFGDSAPEVEWLEVDLAGFASNDTCVEAVGSIRIITP